MLVIQTILIVQNKSSVLYFAVIFGSDSAFALFFRQYEPFTSEYLIKNENQLSTDGLLKKIVIDYALVVCL